MNKLDYKSPGTPSARRVSKLLWVGLAMLVLGAGPLIVEHLYDPSINDIGTGMLAGCTFWPAIGLTIAGTIITVRNRRNAKRPAPPRADSAEQK
jgi:hypothetical protein